MRIFILVLTPILLALSAGLIWLHTPTVEDKAFLEKLHADTRRVHESQQFVANDPEQNGYLQPVARPIWDGSQRELPGELRLWIDTSSSLKAGKALEAPTRDAYEKAKPLLDALGEAFLKPHFVVPNRPIGAESPVVDMAVLKDCGFAMAGWGIAAPGVDARLEPKWLRNTEMKRFRRSSIRVTTSAAQNLS